MAHAKQLEDLNAGWAALAAGEMDKLASFYAEDMSSLSALRSTNERHRTHRQAIIAKHESP